MQPCANFRAMQHSSAEDWKIIAGEFRPFAASLADRVLAHLQLLDGDYSGFPIDRLMHCQQTVSRAQRDGGDEE